MSVFTRLSAALSALTASPADARMAEAERVAFATAVSPSASLALPFSGAQQAAARVPVIDWMGEGMAPPSGAAPPEGYLSHTFKSGGAPIGFEGWGLQRTRNAIALHRLGIFWESSLLMIALLGFAPVLAALQQAIAPIFDLDRFIRGGDKGLAKRVRQDLEDALVPRHGLLPSPYLPPTLWGSMMILIRMMGFVVLQHVDGEPDPVTQIRPRYTRIWPPWAVKYERSLGKWFAYTSEAVVEIVNDAHFTLVCDTLEPHLNDSAIVAIGEEVLSGRLIQQLRNKWFFCFGNPKLVALMAEKVATNSDAGRATFAALQTIVGPDGVGALPYGSDVKMIGLDSKASNSFGAGLASVVMHIAMVLVGSTGTGIDAGEQGGSEVYQAAKGGKWGVRHDLVARPLAAIVRGLNGGHLAPYCEGNHGADIAKAKRAGTWVDPTLDIPLPKPDHEQSIAAKAARFKAALEIVAAAYDDDIAVTDDWLAKLCAPECLDIDPPLTLGTVSGPRILAWHVSEKIVAPDQVLAALKLPPLPDGAGSPKRLAQERLAGKDASGKKASQGDPLIDGKPDTVPESAEPAEAAPTPEGESSHGEGGDRGGGGGHQGS